jgi:hypothetical protein
MKKSYLITILTITLIIIVILLVGCGGPVKENKNQSNNSTQTVAGDEVTNQEDQVTDLESVNSDPGNEKLILQNSEDKKIQYFSPFTGMPIKEMLMEKAVMVSIENAPQAIPQSGLESASIIYEFLVEGGITRFLALYWGDLPDKVGPVRSLRPYLISTALEYNALLLHAGASPAGFEMLEETRIEHLDQIYNGRYYWRSIDREPPHNLYTGSQKIEPYLDKLTGQEYNSRFTFQNVSFINPNDKKADYLIINYWGGTRVIYRFVPGENTYKRFYSLTEKPHLTDQGQQLQARNIIVQYVTIRVVDEVGRLEMELSGRGEALIFRDGIVIEGFWENNGEGWTGFYDDIGQEISLNPGQTWIEVVPTTVNVQYGSEANGVKENRNSDS